MSSPSLPDSKSLTEEIMELVDSYDHHRTWDDDPSEQEAARDAYEAIKSRLSAIESELTELREMKRSAVNAFLGNLGRHNPSAVNDLGILQNVELSDEEGG